MKMMVDVDGKKLEDPEYEAKLMRYRMLVTKYSRCDDEYNKLVKSWKNNRFACSLLSYSIVRRIWYKG